MKKRIFCFLALATMLLTYSLTAQAQSSTRDEAVNAALTAGFDDLVFNSSNTITVEANGVSMRFKTNGSLACLYRFNNYDIAPKVFEVPDAIEYEGKYYGVAAIDDVYYDQRNTTKVVLPNTVRRIMKSAFSSFPNVHDFVIPENVIWIGDNIIGSRDNTVIRLNYKGSLEEADFKIDGRFTSSASSYHVKVYVPAEKFKVYKNMDYIEDYCVISDDWDQDGSYTTVNTGTCDDGELGYIVVADQLPNVRTYADVNKLIINAGTINNDDWYALRQMKNLIYLDISGLSIEEVPYQALYDCWQIEHVILPPTVKKIFGKAFQNTGIKEMILPLGLEEISGGENFRNCDSLTTITIPDGVKSLPGEVFRGCDILHHVDLPNQLETMGSYAFYYCDLYDLTIPGTLKAIPSYAFQYNENLSDLVLSEGIESTSYYSFGYCKSLTELNCPSSMKTIGEYSFRYCDQLATINLNEGLETIDSYAFGEDVALTEVTLPSTLMFCLGYPFSGCNNITTINALSLIPPTVRSNVPTSSAGNINLNVPVWSFQEYMTTPGWLEYQEHIGFIEKLPTNIYINKEFEFVLTEEQNTYGEDHNIKLMPNSEEIDDGFGHVKYERGNLTVSSRSKLAINNFEMTFSPYAKYHADRSRWYYSTEYDYDYTRTVHNPNALVVRGEMRAENVTLNLRLRNNLWQFISFPFDVKMSDIIPADSKTQWVVRYYDAEERAKQNFDSTWKNLTSTDVLEAGKGYIMMCYNQEADNSSTPIVDFTVTPVKESLNRQRIFTGENVVTAVEEHFAPIDMEHNANWNLVGNPFPCFFDTRMISEPGVDDIVLIIWNSNDRKYEAFHNFDDRYILNPGEAFFMQRATADETGTLTFDILGRQTYRNPNDLTVSEAKAAFMNTRSVYNFVLSDGEKTDRVRVVFNDKADMKYEIGRDAAKFMAEDMNVSQIWTANGNAKLAINERPAGDGIVALDMYCGRPGFHTISLGNNCAAGNIVLEDRMMGTRIQLTDDAPYVFSAEQGDITGRFFLHISGSEADAITNVNADVNNNANTYNLNGQRVMGNQRGIVINNGKKTLNK